MKISIKGMLWSFVVLALLFTLAGLYERNVLAPRRRATSIDLLLRSLQDYKPKGLTAQQYDSLTERLWQLNNDLPPEYFATMSDMKRFDEQTRRYLLQLDGKIDLESIVHIWELHDQMYRGEFRRDHVLFWLWELEAGVVPKDSIGPFGYDLQGTHDYFDREYGRNNFVPAPNQK